MPADPFLTRLSRHAGTPSIAKAAITPNTPRAQAQLSPAVAAHLRRRITGSDQTDAETWVRGQAGARAGAVLTIPPGTIRDEGPAALERLRADAEAGDVLIVQETIGGGPAGWSTDETDTVTRLLGAVPATQESAPRDEDLLAPWDGALERLEHTVLGGAVLSAVLLAPGDPQTVRLLLATDAMLVDAAALPPAVVWAAYRVPV